MGVGWISLIGKKRNEEAWEKLRKREWEVSKRLTAWERDRAYFRDGMEGFSRENIKKET